MKCYHHNDHDGRCAAAIVVRFFKDSRYAPVECIEMDYKDTVDMSMIGIDEIIYIVDFSFKPEVMELVLSKTHNVVWLDHHKTAFEYKYTREIQGVRDKEDSGCELTWKWLFTGKKMPRTVELIGDYDKWRLYWQPECFEFYEGLKTFNTDPHSHAWDDFFKDDKMVKTVIDKGKTCIKYRNGYCADIRKSYGYEVEFEGFTCYCMNAYMFGSPGFANLIHDYPICLAYIHDGKEFTVSAYTEQADIDVSTICKKYGGGGHKGAAGFHCKELPFKP